AELNGAISSAANRMTTRLGNLNDISIFLSAVSWDETPSIPAVARFAVKPKTSRCILNATAGLTRKPVLFTVPNAVRRLSLGRKWVCPSLMCEIQQNRDRSLNVAHNCLRPAVAVKIAQHEISAEYSIDRI